VEIHQVGRKAGVDFPNRDSKRSKNNPLLFEAFSSIITVLLFQPDPGSGVIRLIINDIYRTFVFHFPGLLGYYLKSGCNQVAVLLLTPQYIYSLELQGSGLRK
jgi:hypothetical protein